jgi:hypothetical protein
VNPDGFVNEAIQVTVLDQTAPLVPTVNTVSDSSLVVTGKTEAAAAVLVQIGTIKYTSNADASGNYAITIPAQKAGTKITVTSIDAAGNVSPAQVITVVDKTAPKVLTVNNVSDQSKEVSGKTEAGATVTIAIGSEKYTGTADISGNFKITIPVQKAGTKIVINAADQSGNTGANQTITVMDKSAPAVPTVNAVSDQSKEISGKTEAGATVTITIGTVKKVVTADPSGNFKLAISLQKAGTKIMVSAADAAGNVSVSRTLTVLDKTAPATPIVNTVSDQSKEVSGKTEANAKVTISIGSLKKIIIADSLGNFKLVISLLKAGTKITVSAADAAGNVSAARTITVLDKTAPAVPTVNAVSDQSKEVSGKTEASAKVTITIGSVKKTTTADATGNYKFVISPQKAGTKLTVTSVDAAGNSSAKTITVVDKTAPSVPKVDPVSSNSAKVTGKAEANSTITIKVGKNVIGTGTTDKFGHFSVKIRLQKWGTILSITASDTAKNTSKSVAIKVQ